MIDGIITFGVVLIVPLIIFLAATNDSDTVIHDEREDKKK